MSFESPFRRRFDPRKAVARLSTAGPRIPSAGRCQDTSPGHNINFFQAQRINDHPELWRQARVSAASADGRVQGILVDSGEKWFGRHHRSLKRVLGPGTSVQIQPGNAALYIVLAGVLSVRISLDGPVDLQRDCAVLEDPGCARGA